LNVHLANKITFSAKKKQQGIKPFFIDHNKAAFPVYVNTNDTTITIGHRT